MEGTARDHCFWKGDESLGIMRGLMDPYCLIGGVLEKNLNSGRD